MYYKNLQKFKIQHYFNRKEQWNYALKHCRMKSVRAFFRVAIKDYINNRNPHLFDQKIKS